MKKNTGAIDSRDLESNDINRRNFIAKSIVAEGGLSRQFTRIGGFAESGQCPNWTAKK